MHKKFLDEILEKYKLMQGSHAGREYERHLSFLSVFDHWLSDEICQKKVMCYSQVSSLDNNSSEYKEYFLQEKKFVNFFIYDNFTSIIY